MQRTAELLDALKSRHNVGSDRQLRTLIGVSQQTISAYRLGRNFFDDDIAIKVAGLLDLDAAYVVACAHAERAKRPEVKAVWERIARGAAAVFVGAFMVLSLALPYSAKADKIYDVYYVKLVKWLRRWIIGVALMVGATIPAHAADPWSSRDVGLETTYAAVHIADWLQTRAGREQGFTEANPLLGAHPSNGRIDLYFASTLALHAAMVAVLPARYRPWSQILTIGFESSIIAHNARIGVRLSF